MCIQQIYGNHTSQKRNMKNSKSLVNLKKTVGRLTKSKVVVRDVQTVDTVVVSLGRLRMEHATCAANIKMVPYEIFLPIIKSMVPTIKILFAETFFRSVRFSFLFEEKNEVKKRDICEQWN